MLKNLSLSNLDLRKLRQRDITIIIMVLTALLGVLWYFYMFRPTQDRITTLNTDIEALDTKIADGERARDNLPLLEEQLAQAQADKADFLRSLPTESQVSGLLDTLRESATTSGVELTSLSQGGAGDETIQDVRSITFSLATQGEFGPTMTFLDVLENLKRFTKIRQVGFALEGEGIDNPKLTTTYDFNVYVYTGAETADPVIEESSADSGDTGETP